MSFKYIKDGFCIYNNLEFGIDFDIWVVLVGFNGVGKLIFLKLLIGELLFIDGMIWKYFYVKIGCYY